MDKLGMNELMKMSLVAIGASVAVVAVYHFMIAKDDDEGQVAEKTEKK